VRIDSLALVLGGLKAGRLVAPVDPRWPPEEWVEVARRTGGRLVVPDDATPSLVPTRADVDVVRGVVLASPRYVADARAPLDQLLPPDSSGGRRVDVTVTGEHLDLVREPNVAEVARALDRVLVADPA
jgi:hypothetical protein